MTKFLIADDDSDDVELFREALNNISPSIVCYSASDGRELLQKLDAREFEKPDIIFLDINMPQMDGWQCLRCLKDNDTYKSIPVIMYSTSSESRDAEIALKLGALCFYTKPTNFTHLQTVLTVIASNLKGDIVEAVKDYQGFNSHKIFRRVGQ